MLESKRVMAENLQLLMESHGKSRKDVCDGIGVSYTTFTDWVKGNAYPRPDKVEKLAAYFNVSRSDLVDPPRTATVTINGDNATINGAAINSGTVTVTAAAPSAQSKICQMYRSLSPEAKTQIDNLVKMLHGMESNGQQHNK